MRPFYPLLSAERWQQLLLLTGFKQTVTIAPQQDNQSVSQQAVILAQTTEAKSEEAIAQPNTWLILVDSQGIGQQLAALLQAKGQVCTLVFPGQESNGPVHSLLGNRRNLLEVNGFVAEGKLQLNWTYSKNIHQRSTVERLAQNFIEALKSLIAHCQSPEAAGYTPSDFSAARLNQKQLDKFIAKIGETLPKAKLE